MPKSNQKLLNHAVCDSCHSVNLTGNAKAYWHIQEQKWVVDDFADITDIECGDCSNFSEVLWIQSP